MDIRTPRLRVLTSIAAACVALSSVGAGFAQQAPAAAPSGLNVWTAGPDASGANTYVGRVETPRARQSINAGANLLVSGWAADTTAQGWAGFDMVQVYSGTRQNGTKLADGTVGLSRPDVAEALGSGFQNAGFSAVVPASALSNLPTGALTMNVYLHTASKGWYYRTISASLAAAPVLAYPSDPIITFTRPLAGEIITQRQKNSKYSLSGFALDRNAPAPGQNPGGGASGCHCGVASVFMYLDKMPGQPGYTPAQNDLGVGNVGPCGIGCGFGPLVNNAAGRSPAVDWGDVQGSKPPQPNLSYVTAQYGPQFNLSGFSVSVNPNAYNPNLPLSSSNIPPDMFHTIYAVATSSITGKTSVATTSLFIRSTGPSFPASAAVAP